MMNKSFHRLQDMPWQKWFVYVILLLPLTFIFWMPQGFPYPSAEAKYSDFALTHFANALFIQRSLFSGQGIPLWNPYIYSGTPFYANPLSGLTYPPGWFALIFPLPFGLNLCLLLHLWLGSLAVYASLRQENVSFYPAIISAIGFSLLPKVIAHYGAGHVSLIYSFSWTPWLLWAARGKKPIWEVLFLSLALLADVRWGIYSIFLWAFYYVYIVLEQKLILRTFTEALGKLVIAILICAPLLLPLIEFTTLSTRVTMRPEDRLSFSFPLDHTLQLIFPDFGGFHEWIVYPGAGVILLVLMHLFRSKRNTLDGFLGIVFVGALIFSYGENVPLVGWLAAFPIISLLRVPSRALFLVGLCSVYLAGSTLEALSNGRENFHIRRVNLSLFGSVTLCWAVFLGIWFLTHEVMLNILWGTLMISCSAALIFFCLNRNIPPNALTIGFFVLCALDWGATDRSLYVIKPAPQILSENHALVQFLKSKQNELFRIYSPTYSLPQNLAVQHEIYLAEGVDPLQLRNYSEYFALASGVPYTHYTVTLPVFESGNPDQDTRGYMPDVERLGWLNVRFVVSLFPLEVEGLLLDERIENLFVYKNQFYRPRAWLEADDSLGGARTGEVRIIRWTANRIVMRASGPGRLVLSEVSYPAWRASVDGKKAHIEEVHEVFRSVWLGAGDHFVEFSLQPWSLYWGLIIFTGTNCFFAIRSILIRRILHNG